MIKSLPERWKVMRDKDNCDIINEWATNQNDDFGEYNAIDGWILSHTYNDNGWFCRCPDSDEAVVNDYEEITFEEFKKFVVNRFDILFHEEQLTKGFIVKNPRYTDGINEQATWNLYCNWLFNAYKKDTGGVIINTDAKWIGIDRNEKIVVFQIDVESYFSDLDVLDIEDWYRIIHKEKKEDKMTKRKIIGFKTPMDLYGGYIKKGEIFKPFKVNYYKTNKTGDTEYSKHMPAEIVETWEAVYEEMYKVGDWVYYDENHRDLFNSSAQISQIKEFKDGRVIIEDGSVLTMVDELQTGVHDKYLRLATQEEIERAKNVLPEIGGKKCIDNGDRTITCGCTTKSFDWIEGVYYVMRNSSIADVEIQRVKVSIMDLSKIVKYIKKKGCLEDM